MFDLVSPEGSAPPMAMDLVQQKKNAQEKAARRKDARAPSNSAHVVTSLEQEPECPTITITKKKKKKKKTKKPQKRKSLSEFMQMEHGESQGDDDPDAPCCSDNVSVTSGCTSSGSSVISSGSFYSTYSNDDTVGGAYGVASSVVCQSLVVDGLWEQIKAMDDYQARFGEHVARRLMELDPSSRQLMDIHSSKRFDEICQILVHIVDTMIGLMGPFIDESLDLLLEMGDRCAEEGIPVSLMPDAVTEAVKLFLMDHDEHSINFTEQDDHAWKSVLTFVVGRMSLDPDDEEP